MRIIVRYGGKIGGMEGGRHLLLRFLFIVSAALMAFVFAVIFVLDSFLIKGKIDGRNIKNFGPVYVPGKGDKVTLGKSEFSWYRKLIRFETGVEPEINTMGHVLLDGSRVTEYEFKGNWYFLGGDNVLDSRDSRYFGLVPEEYIVGIII